MKQKLCMALLAGMGLMSGAQAAVVTLSGTLFDVRYDDTQVGLFGAPSLFGSTIFFTPSGFKAESLNGDGPVAALAFASIELIAHSGFRFASIGVGQAGDYRLSGAGSTVGVAGQITATDAANAAATQTAGLAVTAPLDVADGALREWSASAAVDNTGLSAPWLGQAQSVIFTLSNELTATTQAGGTGPLSAFIEGKFAGVALTVNGVPTPGTLPLVGLAALALLGTRRRA